MKERKRHRIKIYGSDPTHHFGEYDGEVYRVFVMTDMIRFDKLDLQAWIKNKSWIEFHVNNQLYYVVRGKIQKSAYGVFYLYNIKRL